MVGWRERGREEGGRDRGEGGREGGREGGGGGKREGGREGVRGGTGEYGEFPSFFAEASWSEFRGCRSLKLLPSIVAETNHKPPLPLGSSMDTHRHQVSSICML